MRVLIVEDEKRLAQALGQIMEEQRYQVDIVYDGQDGLDYALSGQYDIVVLDVMLPKKDGFEVVRQLREINQSVPVLMLTARDDVTDKVLGLDCGADDYMTKPFSPEELLARIRALSRRQGDVLLEDIHWADLTLKLSSRTLHCGAKSVSLGFKEFEVLKLLLANPNGIVSKEELLVKVWGSDSNAEDNNVEAYISFLNRFNMTKQLRKQFILVNMLLVGTVLLVVFAALGVSTYRRQVQDSQRVLERYFMEKGNTPSPKLDFGAHRDWKDFPMRFSFCAVLDSDGGLVSYQSENLTLSRQTVEQAVQAAAEEVESTQKESGTLSGLDLRYLAKEQDGQLRIAFVERTQEYASMQDFLVAAFLLGSAGLMVLFLASWLLSSWVVRPVERSWAQQKQFVADASHEL